MFFLLLPSADPVRGSQSRSYVSTSPSLPHPPPSSQLPPYPPSQHPYLLLSLPLFLLPGSLHPQHPFPYVPHIPPLHMPNPSHPTVQPERNARTKFSYNQFANLVAFGLHVNLARIWPNWLKTKFSPGVSFWLYCILCNFVTELSHPCFPLTCSFVVKCKW